MMLKLLENLVFIIYLSFISPKFISRCVILLSSRHILLFHVKGNFWKRNNFSWFFILVISKYLLLWHISNLPAAICWKEQCKKNVKSKKVIKLRCCEKGIYYCRRIILEETTSRISFRFPPCIMMNTFISRLMHKYTKLDVKIYIV
jgi:hypothetical protein